MPGDVQAERVGAVFASGEDICWAVLAPDSESLRLQTLGPDRSLAVATVPLDGLPFAIEPIDGGQRLAIACELVNPSAEGKSQPIRTWQLVEVSMVTGRELYRGSPRFPSLDFGEGVRLLGVGMMAITGFVLFYLLRPPSRETPVALPEGWVLASPGRRLFAGLLDVWLVAGVSGMAFGVPLGDFVLVLPLFESAKGVVTLGTVIVGGAMYSTASEWMLGCTLGKAAVGIRVVSVDPSRPTLGLMRCGARNVFRWALAPWAFLGLSVPDFRHRGDLVAAAAVVTRPDKAGGPPQTTGRD